MMRKERRNIAFSLSFLDIMACGFGAVTLVFLILSYSLDEAVGPNTREETEIKDLQEDVNTAESELDKYNSKIIALESNLDVVNSANKDLMDAVQQSKIDLDMRRFEYDKLDNKVRLLESELTSLEEEDPQERWYGKNLLTGLDFSGQRILILVDGSASMLSETVQEAIQLGFAIKSGQATVEDAKKWQWVVKTVDWLVANIGENVSFQVYLFNTSAQAAIADTLGQWLSSDQIVREDIVNALRTYVPKFGTSLENVLVEVKDLDPRPDLVLILTDGLPTQGQAKPKKYMITPSERRKYFLDAASQIPVGVPVSTILYPLDGDPEAALLYWKLAYDSKGSFITPSRDWP